MKKVELKDVKPYVAAKHFNMTALKLHETASQKFWMGLSHFLPQGGAELDSSPPEKLYFVLDGEVTVVDANGQKLVLRKWDSLYLGKNESRSIVNETNLPASMLVVINQE